MIKQLEPPPDWPSQFCQILKQSCKISLLGMVLPFVTSAENTPQIDTLSIEGDKESISNQLQREVYPYHVSIIEINPQEVQNLSFQSFLEQQTSIQVQSFGGRADYSTLSIRGSSSAQVTFFIDGLEINRGDRQSVDLSTLNLDQFERVEIYRSNAPARFGTGKMGGVINLISRKPLKIREI